MYRDTDIGFSKLPSTLWILKIEARPRSEIRQSTIYYAGLLGQWDKRIVDQESDVPSITFIYTFYRFRALKILYFYFCNFIKKIRK